MCNVAKAVMIEWNKLGFVICERSLYMQIFNLDRSYLLLSFNLITLSSLAIPSKSFLFTPFSFYEGIQDLDSMARNIQIFILSVRHQYHLGDGLPSLHHPVLALSWDIAPPLLLVLF